ncbi:hypothetical protein ACFPN1_06400 [Lysobacter yangpyeongensis]|uniref:Lipoprotein n=1 Tax=Lysobacter yangpyeongensis TaxID=346182 RepID=A0ABW0SKT4_9GAMM
MKISCVLLVGFFLTGCVSVTRNDVQLTGRLYVENAQAELLHGGATVELSSPVNAIREVRLVDAPKYIYAQFEEFDGATVEVTGDFIDSELDGPKPFRVNKWRVITPAPNDWSRRLLNEDGDILVTKYSSEITGFLTTLREHVANDAVNTLLCKNNEGELSQASGLMRERTQWLLITGRNSLRSKIAVNGDVAVFQRRDSVDAYLQEYVICMGAGAGALNNESPLFPLAAPEKYGCFVVWKEKDRVCPVL